MHEFSVGYIRCVRCKGRFELEILNYSSEINEGFLYCNKCKLTFPIISKIPILVDDFISYLSNRTKLGGSLYLKTKHHSMKSFLKKSLSKVKKLDDRTLVEERWVRIYQNSTRSRFYSIIRDKLGKLPKSKLALEHGCSIGTTSRFMARNNDITFGIDRSYNGISAAKKTKAENLDFFVADSIEHPFGNQKFGLVVALNLLELVEPKQLIRMASKQIKKGTFVLSDPYDYDRGELSVRNQVKPGDLRKELIRYGFSLIFGTKKPSFIPWNLNLNPRTKLNYSVDLIIGEKT